MGKDDRKSGRVESAYFLVVVANILGLIASLVALGLYKDRAWAFPALYLSFSLFFLGLVGGVLIFKSRRWPPSLPLVGCVVLGCYAGFLFVMNCIRLYR